MSPQSATPKLRALIVDDTASLLSCFRLVLRPLEQAWELLFATSGEEALDIVCEEPVDVLICDLNMPSMAGDEVISMVQLKHPETDCFLMTGCALDDEQVLSVGGLSGIFHKPCDLRQIRATLETREARQMTLLPQAA